MATGRGVSITWKTEEPVWVPQWSLSSEKLEAARILVLEQLNLGHIKSFVSPWNTPAFVIKKSYGKWKLLQDLRAINRQMQIMGPVQHRLPLLTYLPPAWPIISIDIKDCFFSIPLCSKDSKRFAFTLPSCNHEQPDLRCEWVMLPQGMGNSPTICQLFIGESIAPLRTEFPTIRCIQKKRNKKSKNKVIKSHIKRENTQRIWILNATFLTLNCLIA